MYGPPFYYSPPDEPELEAWQEELQGYEKDEPIPPEVEEMLPADTEDVWPTDDEIIRIVCP